MSIKNNNSKKYHPLPGTIASQFQSILNVKFILPCISGLIFALSSVYAWDTWTNKKVLQLCQSSKGKIEILILRDYKQDYYRPSVLNLDITNIRKYNPDIKSYRIPWGYMFYKVLLLPEEFDLFKNIIYQFINAGYNTAKDNKILKVTNDNHQILESIFNNVKEL